jgi:hypothetical protein
MMRNKKEEIEHLKARKRRKYAKKYWKEKNG